jgi:putative Ca2+/H+ antiporter (TMEM165/GDT1 family)
MSALFFSTFGLIFVAELPDKTAFATLLMATQGNPRSIFAGVAAAFLVQSAIAVCFGSFFTKLPPEWIHLGAGILFLLFAFMAWRRNLDADHDTETSATHASGVSKTETFWQTASKSFVVIFIAEWGDLTQLASASLTAKYQAPLIIFSASTLALWTVTAIAIVLGNRLQKSLNTQLLTRLAAIAFACVGIYFIISWARTH